MTAMPSQIASLAPGFANPVIDAQASFRALLDAMAHPGRIVSIAADLDAPQPLAPASLAVILTLCDHETTLWLDETADSSDIAPLLRFHCGVRLIEERSQAAFGLCCGALPALQGFACGTADYPELSATVICQVASLGEGAGYTLRGPGIDRTTALRAEGLPQDFLSQWTANRALFPQGIDLILTQGRSLCALPRSLIVERET